MSKCGFALLSHFYKDDRIPYFDIRHSVFDVRYSFLQSFFSDQTGRSAASGWARAFTVPGLPNPRTL
jgi:hypothetical protein